MGIFVLFLTCPLALDKPFSLSVLCQGWHKARVAAAGPWAQRLPIRLSTQSDMELTNDFDNFKDQRWHEVNNPTI